MADTIKIEDIEERVVLVGVSEQDGDDADDSLSELAELVNSRRDSCRHTYPKKRKDSSGHVCRHRQGGGDCRACGEYRGNRHCVR